MERTACSVGRWCSRSCDCSAGCRRWSIGNPASLPRKSYIVAWHRSEGDTHSMPQDHASITMATHATMPTHTSRMLSASSRFAPSMVQYLSASHKSAGSLDVVLGTLLVLIGLFGNTAATESCENIPHDTSCVGRKPRGVCARLPRHRLYVCPEGLLDFSASSCCEFTVSIVRARATLAGSR